MSYNTRKFNNPWKSRGQNYFQKRYCPRRFSFQIDEEISKPVENKSFPKEQHRQCQRRMRRVLADK